MFQLFMHKSSPKEAKRLRQLSVFSLSFFCAPNHKRKINRAVIPDDGEKFSEGIIFLFLLHNYTCSLFVLHMYKIHRVDGENKSLSFSTHSTHITSTTGGRGGPVAFMYDSHVRPPHLILPNQKYQPVPPPVYVVSFPLLNPLSCSCHFTWGYWTLDAHISKHKKKM